MFLSVVDYLVFCILFMCYVATTTANWAGQLLLHFSVSKGLRNRSCLLTLLSIGGFMAVLDR